MNLVNRINNFILKAEKVYLSPGESPPKGVNIQRGKRGGRYYISGEEIKVRPKEELKIPKYYNRLELEDKEIQRLSKLPIIKFDNLGGGYNVTKLARFNGEIGVFKPVYGEHKMGSLKKGTMYLREVCAYHINKALKFDYVPPTAVRVEKEGIGSIQKFIKEANVGKVKQCNLKDIEKMAFFDIVTGNLDRITANWLIKNGRPIAIDNGRCFPGSVNDKVRSKFVSFLWEKEIPDELISLILTKRSKIYKLVKSYIGKDEAILTLNRIDYLIKNRKYNYFGKER